MTYDDNLQTAADLLTSASQALGEAERALRSGLPPTDEAGRAVAQARLDLNEVQTEILGIKLLLSVAYMETPDIERIDQ